MTTTIRNESAAIDAYDPADDEPAGERHRGRRAIVILAIAAVVAASGGTAYVLTRDDTEPAAAQAATTTEPVTLQDLSETAAVTGTLTYADPGTVSAGRDGTMTWLPDETTVVERGGTLARVDNLPVTLLYGTLPLWRDLSYGVDDGPDVKQLEENLVALGVTPSGFTVDEHFSTATREAVEDLQEQLGLEETGVVTAAEFGIAAGPVRVGAHETAVGDRVGADAPIYASSSTSPLVTADLSPTQARNATVGAAASVTLPDGTRVDGTIASIGATKANADGTAVVPVTVTLADAAAAGQVSGAPVSVEIVTQVTAGALTVPVTALVALAEGGYAVEVVDEAGRSSFVAVEPGAYAGGRVAVTGDGIAEGMKVVVPS